MGLNAESRIAVCGTRSTGEIVFLALCELDIEEIDFYDKDPEPGQRFVGMPLRDVATLEPAAYDKIIVTQLENKDMGIEILDNVSISPEKLQTLFSHSNKENPE